MTATQTSLFAAERPTEIEVSGAELAGSLADLKARGCTVLAMASVCTSRWQLSLSWPEPKQKTLRQPVTENALTQTDTGILKINSFRFMVSDSGDQTRLQFLSMSPKNYSVTCHHL